MGYCSGRGRVKERCYCTVEKVHCRYANSCTHCIDYDGVGMCKRDMTDEYDIQSIKKCRNNKEKCFYCEYLIYKPSNKHCAVVNSKSKTILFDEEADKEGKA